MCNYSIVIPHKNIPLLLDRCLASIPMRDDVQVIVVDDNSNDDTLSQLLELESRYRLVEFIYTKCSKGAGYARNMGLARAQGKWLLFADADDYFSHDLDALLDKYIDVEFDIVFFNYASVYSNTLKVLDLKSFRHSRFDNLIRSKDYLEAYLRYEFGPPWSKMVKRSLIEKYHIKFDESTKHNDTMFSLKIGYYAQTISMESMVLYFNTYRVDSITNAKIEDKVSYVDNILGVALRYKRFSEVKKIKKVNWRFCNIVELLLRTDFTLLFYILSFLVKNRLLFYFIFYFPIYCIRRIVKLIFKPKNWLF